MVVSDLNTELTMDVVGKEWWPEKIWEKGQKLKEKPPTLDDKGYERTQLFWGNVALMEAPKYPQNQELGYGSEALLR